jgi:hypothetical protein
MSNTNSAAVTAELLAASDRILAPMRARNAQYYTLASAQIHAAGGVSALVAFTACPTAARERMVAAAREFYRTTRDHRDAHRATDGLILAMRAWNLETEADALADHKDRL